MFLIQGESQDVGRYSVSLPGGRAPTQQPQPLLVTVQVEMSLPVLQAPGIQLFLVHHASCSKHVQHHKQEDEHACTALVGVIYPTVLDLEEDVLDEADRALRLKLRWVGGDFRQRLEDGYSRWGDPVACFGDVPEAAVLYVC